MDNLLECTGGALQYLGKRCALSYTAYPLDWLIQNNFPLSKCELAQKLLT